jgi:hypothetical protein
LLPRYACAASPRVPRRIRDLSRVAGQTGFWLPHVTPIKADKLRRKTMTNIDFTLLIDALARLVAVLTTFVIALRRRRR